MYIAEDGHSGIPNVTADGHVTADDNNSVADLALDPGISSYNHNGARRIV